MHPADPPVWGAPVVPNGGRPSGCRATDAEESHRGRQVLEDGPPAPAPEETPRRSRRTSGPLGVTMSLFTGGGVVPRRREIGAPGDDVVCTIRRTGAFIRRGLSGQARASQSTSVWGRGPAPMLPGECLPALLLGEAMTTRVSRTVEAFTERRSGRPGQWEAGRPSDRRADPVGPKRRTLTDVGGPHGQGVCAHSPGDVSAPPKVFGVARSDDSAAHWRGHGSGAGSMAKSPERVTPAIPNGGSPAESRATEAEESH